MIGYFHYINKRFILGHLIVSEWIAFDFQILHHFPKTNEIKEPQSNLDR